MSGPMKLMARPDTAAPRRVSAQGGTGSSPAAAEEASTTEVPTLLPADDLRELMQSVAETTERLESTHAALQCQVARLQRELADANAQLQRSRSLAALGEMAAGIAHEVRNPLGSIQLYVQVLAEELQDRPEQAKLCKKIDRAVVGLDAIVRDVLLFARNMTVNPRLMRAGDLLDRAIDGCDGLIDAADVQIRRDIDAGDLHVDPSLMTQAIGNVLRNAIEAIVAAEGAPEQEREVRVSVRQQVVRCPHGEPAERLVIAVEDTGPGIPAEVVERMFNPFFTTRKTGTGLGLAIVHRIVDAHGGHINVSSRKPHGARIELCLPTEGCGEQEP